MQRQQFTQHNPWRHYLALLLTISLGWGVVKPSPVQAATITVTTTADSGAGSLRQAIISAAAGDTITFNLPNPSVITLNSELVIAKNLTIQGPGAAALTISGANKSRVFFINPGTAGAISGPPSARPTVTITKLTIANGYAAGYGGGSGGAAGSGGGGAGLGGAIFSNHSTLTINGVTFSANRAQGGSGGPSVYGASDGYGGGGMGRPNSYGYGTDGGALGGKGGAVAKIGGPEGIWANGGLGPIGGDGGEGAGGGGGIGIKVCTGTTPCSLAKGPGGNGGWGGGGGGGGGSINTVYGPGGSTGIGGKGGFGGGGGGGGGYTGTVLMASAGGNGGTFGGNGGKGGVYAGKGGPGGGGAGLGGAIFIRAGTLTLIDSSFLNNRAQGGSGVADSDAKGGQGKGGAIFLLTPATMTMSGCATFSGNSAANAAGSASDTNDLYGRTMIALPLCTSGVVAAVAAAETGAESATQPLTVTTVAAAPPITQSVPVSMPAVETAPVVAEVVAEAPGVTTTENVTPVDEGVAPVDANAPVPSDTSGPNQQIFLPIIANLAGAAVGSPSGIAVLGLVVLVVVGIIWRRRSLTR